MAISETFLLLGVASCVAAIGIALALLFGGPGKKAPQQAIIGSHDESTAVPVAEGIHADQGSHMEASPEADSMSSMVAASVSSAPIQEAPAPFPEEVTTRTTPTPTDITALANMTSPVDGAPGILVIPTVKRKRTKRLPTQGAIPRKRRTTKKSVMVPATPQFVETQQPPPESPQVDSASDQKSGSGVS